MPVFPSLSGEFGTYNLEGRYLGPIKNFLGSISSSLYGTFSLSGSLINHSTNSPEITGTIESQFGVWDLKVTIDDKSTPNVTFSGTLGYISITGYMTNPFTSIDDT